MKFDEPFYVKKLKLDILVEIASESNFTDILNEMEEYANDVNATFAKQTIKSIGNLAVRVKESVNTVVNLLKSFMLSNIDYIVSESVEVLESK